MVAPSQAGLDFIERQAEHLATVDGMAEDRQDGIRARIADLLAHPEERDGDLYAGRIGESFVRELDAGEDPAELIEWWYRLRDLLSLSWEDLHSIPAAQRTTDWRVAQEVILSLAIEQAVIESGLILDVLLLTARDAPARDRALEAMSPKEVAGLARATGVADRSKAMQLATLDGQIAETTDPEERERLERKRASLRRRQTR